MRFEWARNPLTHRTDSYFPSLSPDLSKLLAASMADTCFFAGEATIVHAQTGTVFDAVEIVFPASRELLFTSANFVLLNDGLQNDRSNQMNHALCSWSAAGMNDLHQNEIGMPPARRLSMNEPFCVACAISYIENVEYVEARVENLPTWVKIIWKLARI